MTSEESGAATRWILFDEVEIDLAGRRLFVAGTQTALEPKAFGVLALFAQHPGRAFARDEILDAVWGHRHVTPGVLNRIITLLRHALGESARHTQYIATLHGVGYRFDAATQSRAQRETEVAPELDPPARFAAIPDADMALPGVTEAPAHTAPRKLRSAAAWLAALVAVAIAGWTFWPHPRTAESTPVEKQSVAVLPLKNATGDTDQQFFVDGIAECLIVTLTQSQGLKVIGLNSSMRFRDSSEGSQEIGKKLGVAHLLEGSVHREGDHLRIMINLIRADDGATLWTQHFDRPYKDLFAIQDQIASTVAGALQVKLLHAAEGAVEAGRPASGNLDAYIAFLRGVSHMGDSAQAIEHYAQAVQIDPSYAQAWAWMGYERIKLTLKTLSGDTAREAYMQAREEIDTALRLKPNFGQAHAIRGYWLSSADHDWNGALAEFRVALALVPETDPTRGMASQFYATLGRVHDAIAESSKYIDGDPLSAYMKSKLAGLQASLGELDEAQASLREAEQLDSKMSDWYAASRTEYAILRGDAKTARAEASHIAAAEWRERMLTLALQIGGDRKAADAALQRLTDANGRPKGDVYAIARVYALRGDADKTFEWLQRDWKGDGVAITYLMVDPLLLRFRNDPRFAAYCQRAGLPPPTASEALSLDEIRARLARRLPKGL